MFICFLGGSFLINLPLIGNPPSSECIQTVFKGLWSLFTLQWMTTFQLPKLARPTPMIRKLLPKYLMSLKLVKGEADLITQRKLYSPQLEQKGIVSSNLDCCRYASQYKITQTFSNSSKVLARYINKSFEHCIIRKFNICYTFFDPSTFSHNLNCWYETRPILHSHACL